MKKVSLRNASCLLFGLFSLNTGCKEEPLTTSEVFKLEVCPPGSGEREQGDAKCGSEVVADGRSEVVVRVCPVLTQERRNDLVATVKANKGRFSEPSSEDSPRTAQVSINANACGETRLTAPTDVGYLRIEANLEGYSASELLTLTPAPIESVVLDPATYELEASKPSTIVVSVHASGLNGAPLSNGSGVEITLEPTPATARAIATPRKFTLDEEGNGKFSVFTARGVSNVTVTATVGGPQGEDIETVTPASSTIELRVFAGDAGTD